MGKKFQILSHLTIITVVITAVFGCFYWHCIRNSLPLSYEGDAFQVLVGIQGNATGENNPFTLRSLHRLNAPFYGSWCDYPFEKIISWGAALLCRSFGLAEGTTLAVLFLQILAGLCFYAAGRPMRVHGCVLIAASVLFGLAPYAFLQNLQHLTLTAYWHIPLLVLTLLWLGWPERVNLPPRSGLMLGCVAAFIAGNLIPYYLGPFLALGPLFERNWRKIGMYGVIVGSAFAGFLIQNFDTLVYAALHGRNSEAVSRDLWWMIKFGLYLPDLFFPRAHQNELVSRLSWAIYQSRVPSQLWGESQTAYIGVISILALVVMLVSGVALISSRKFERISPFFWLTLGLIVFSMAGGINYLLGSLGFLFLRATDRSSIMISSMALYFLCEKFPLHVDRRWGALLAAIMIGVGIWDQLPRYPVWEETSRQQAWRDFKSDQVFFGTMEKELPRGAMVFEFPVKDYPEMGPVNQMGDYEHFRPVLHTRELRFSYGTIKGRGDTDWQKRVSTENAPEIVRDLTRYGFSAILVNRKAYTDRGETLRKVLCEAGAQILEENNDFVIMGIQSDLNPVLPLKDVNKT